MFSVQGREQFVVDAVSRQARQVAYVGRPPNRS